MGVIASQITSLTIVFSSIYPDADERKHQSSASLVFVWGIHRGPVNSPHKWPVTRKMFPFDDVIMCDGLSIWMPSYQYKDSHHKDNTVSRLPYLYNWYPVPGNTAFTLKWPPVRMSAFIWRSYPQCGSWFSSAVYMWHDKWFWRTTTCGSSIFRVHSMSFRCRDTKKTVLVGDIKLVRNRP